MRGLWILSVTAVLCVFGSVSSGAVVTTIYEDTFSRGSTGTPVVLNTSTPGPTSGGKTWTAASTGGVGISSNFVTDGAVLRANNATGAAYLLLPTNPLNPAKPLLPDSVYTLSATLTSPTGMSNFGLSLGFGTATTGNIYATAGETAKVKAGVVWSPSGTPVPNPPTVTNPGRVRVYKAGSLLPSVFYSATGGLSNDFTIKLTTNSDLTNGEVVITDKPSFGYFPGTTATNTKFNLTAADLGAITAVLIGGHNDYGTIDNFKLTVAPVPEPTSLALFGMGTMALLVRRRRSSV